MYAGYFGLRQSPFSIAPDPHYLFMSERHREALAHLLYGVQGGGGFVLLTGEIGAGKTTVCRAFLEQIPENCRVAYIFNPKLTVGDLLKTICHEFQLEVKHEGIGPATIKDHLDPLNTYLLACHAAGQHNVLIIDEAQNLTTHVLEQLRLLTNLETSERKLLQIVLIGQPELRKMIAQPELEQLAQRVIARFHLGALSVNETRQYVQHRMAVAGLTGPLPFSDAALARVHALTRGVPRRINLLCDRALLGAYATDTRQIGADVVDKAAQEVFDAPPPAPGQALQPTLPRRPWAALALAALGGACVAGLAGLTLWFWPGRPPLASAPAAASTQPVAAVAGPSVAPPSLPSAAAEASTVPVRAASASTDALTAEPAHPLLASPPNRAEMLASETAGWRELAPLWGQTLNEPDPCAQAQLNGLQCFRVQRMTMHGLRQLNRPGMLTLRLPDGQARVLVTALGADTATLQAGERRWQMPLTALTDIWRGDYATLWRTPPGTSVRINSAGNGPARQWIDIQLLALQSNGRLAADLNSHEQRLAAFQRSQGIETLGRATPLTFMQVNLATGVDEPRLVAR